MSWQKCPVCNGTGLKEIPYVSNTLDECDVCKGMKIISEETGLPPSFSENLEQNQWGDKQELNPDGSLRVYY